MPTPLELLTANPPKMAEERDAYGSLLWVVRVYSLVAGRYLSSSKSFHESEAKKLLGVENVNHARYLAAYAEAEVRAAKLSTP